MKKKLISLALLFAMLLSFVACVAEEAPTPAATTAAPTTTTAATTAKPADPTEPGVLDKSKHYSFLFIGNSYTHYNKMPEQLFANIMLSAGYKVTVSTVVKGSWNLLDFANPLDTYGAQVEKALADTKYDFVVMQEQSTRPIVSPEKFYTGVREMLKKVEANGATPILYGTWGRQTGSSTLTSNGWTNESMTWMLTAAYEAIGEEMGVDVAKVGLAFYDVHKNNPSIVIYDEDKSHPSAMGSYLAALTIFAKITGVDPTTVKYSAGINAESAAILKEAARKAVFETPETPDTFKTSSKGVEYRADYQVDVSKTKNLTALPAQSTLISVLQGGTYPNGKSFSGILGTKNAVASTKYSTSGLSDSDKADIADIGYGVSVIGIEKMLSDSKGYTTAVENLVNGSWSSSYMACFNFDDKTYNVKGEVDATAPYRALITLNFGSKHKFNALGFSSGNLKGFPGAAEVYVSDDGVNWTRVPTACWDALNGSALTSCGKTPADPWNGSTGSVTCLFDMSEVTGQYIRLGIVTGRYDAEDKYNSINTRELLVYGEKLN